MIFVASHADVLRQASENRNVLIAVNELMSEKSLAIIEAMIAEGRNVFIDSGIFNLATSHAKANFCTMDVALGMAPQDIDGFSDLWERYLEVVGRVGRKCWGYIELDQGGRDNKRKTREKLESLGLRPIPVYHPINDGWDYFDELASRYDRICLGNVVKASNAVRVRILATVQERRQDYPGLKWIHSLGVSPCRTLFTIGTESADASTWLWSIRWGKMPVAACMKRTAQLSDRYFYRRGEGPEACEDLVRLIGYDMTTHERMYNYHRQQVEELFQ